MSDPNYASLFRILERAHYQAAVGKGHERHVARGEPFEEQIICWLQRRGYDYARGQCVKKVDESLRLPPEAAIRELLGAINYLAAAVIVLEEKANAREDEPKETKPAGDIWWAQLLVEVYARLDLKDVLTEYRGRGIQKLGDSVVFAVLKGSPAITVTADKSFVVYLRKSIEETAAAIAKEIIALSPPPWKAIALTCKPTDGVYAIECIYGVIPKEAT